ncbi:MFS superfamily sulfate permease-like transporter [Arthrobacter bambusae]|nr:MFS superfamily sulfate permease-like transporter [Arthrobacter bambusae]MDQ0097328.1 MFS superfamily sulfate permease-like transporter [Arthrobacter bambusae]
MNARAAVFSALATGLLVLVVPYVFSALFDVAPNGSETLIVVILLWVTVWAVCRARLKRDTNSR